MRSLDRITRRLASFLDESGSAAIEYALAATMLGLATASVVASLV